MDHHRQQLLAPATPLRLINIKWRSAHASSSPSSAASEVKTTFPDIITGKKRNRGNLTFLHCLEGVVGLDEFHRVGDFLALQNVVVQTQVWDGKLENLVISHCVFLKYGTCRRKAVTGCMRGGKRKRWRPVIVFYHFSFVFYCPKPVALFNSNVWNLSHLCFISAGSCATCASQRALTGFQHHGQRPHMIRCVKWSNFGKLTAVTSTAGSVAPFPSLISITGPVWEACWSFTLSIPSLSPSPLFIKMASAASGRRAYITGKGFRKWEV